MYTLDTLIVHTTHHHNPIDLVDQLSGISAALNDLREQQDMLVAQQHALFQQQHALLTEESVLLQEQAAIFAQLTDV